MSIEENSSITRKIEKQYCTQVEYLHARVPSCGDTLFTDYRLRCIGQAIRLCSVGTGFIRDRYAWYVSAIQVKVGGSRLTPRLVIRMIWGESVTNACVADSSGWITSF